MSVESNYSEGKRCPVCGVRITNKARFCRKHTAAFANWLRWLYGRSVRFSKQQQSRGGARAKGERTRRRILEILRRQGALSTLELGRALDMTIEGARYAVKRLEKDGRVRRSEGFRMTWSLVGGD